MPRKETCGTYNFKLADAKGEIIMKKIAIRVVTSNQHVSYYVDGKLSTVIGKNSGDITAINNQRAEHEKSVITRTIKDLLQQLNISAVWVEVTE